jgi:putative membrane protein
MSRMATQLRRLSFASLLGLCASSAFAQSPAEFHQ